MPTEIGPQVSQLLGKYLNTMVADLNILYKGQYLRELFSRYEIELAKAVSPSLESQPVAIRLLALMYDRWEDGTPCYEDAEGCAGPLGNAVKLSFEEENEIIAALKGVPRTGAAPPATETQPEQCSSNSINYNAEATAKLMQSILSTPADESNVLRDRELERLRGALEELRQIPKLPIRAHSVIVRVLEGEVGRE
jgi:hypothetical protein